MQKFFHYLVLVTTLLGGGTAWAAAITGSVTNGTTNRPASGDDVVLLTLSEDGMSESARVKTDSAGHFLFKIIESAGSHLVRVVHQGVTYHSIVPADGKRLKIKVYDVAEKLAGISAVMDVQRFEATDDTLEIKQLVTMRNSSRPPRTLLNDRPFEIQLPPNAKVQSRLVQYEGGQPLKQSPVADEQKGQYHFVFPLRPGDTRFAVVYRLPYTGEALIEPQLRNPLEQFVVMLPKSMKFEPKTVGIFQPRPNVTPDHVEGTGQSIPDRPRISDLGHRNVGRTAGHSQTSPAALASIDDRNVIQAQEPAFEDVVPFAIDPVHPPGEIDQQLVQTVFEKTAIVFSVAISLHAHKHDSSPCMHRRIQIGEFPLVRGDLPIRMLELFKQQHP